MNLDYLLNKYKSHPWDYKLKPNKLKFPKNYFDSSDEETKEFNEIYQWIYNNKDFV